MAKNSPKTPVTDVPQEDIEAELAKLGPIKVSTNITMEDRTDAPVDRSALEYDRETV